MLLSSGVTVTIGGFGAMGIYLTGLAVEVGLENNCLLAVGGTGDEYRSWADSGDWEPSDSNYKLLNIIYHDKWIPLAPNDFSLGWMKGLAVLLVSGLVLTGMDT